MLRASLRSVRAVSGRPAAAAAGRQLQGVVARSAGVAARRGYADEKKPSIDDHKPIVLPATGTNTPAPSETPIPKIEADISSSTVSAQKVPLTPPPPPPAAAAVEAPAPKSIPPPPKRRSFLGRLTRWVFYLTFLGAAAFGGGVYYSRINDNFHDFFTEYIPYGEQAVLYLEEQDFKKRFPRSPLGGSRTKETGPVVKVSPQSGASWRVADSGEPTGRQSSAVRPGAAAKTSAVEKKAEPAPETKPAPVPEVKKEPEAAKPVVAAKQEKPAEKPAKPAFKAPEVDEPSRFPPAGPIDPLKVKDAEEPVVQDLVKMLNDIITVVNADNSDDRFSNTIGKAKNELNKVGSKIKDLKAKVEKEAASQVASKVSDFESAANQLVERVEKAMAAQEAQWRAEFEQEMKRVREAYDSRIKTEMEREGLVQEQKLANKLLEQAVELKQQFTQDVKDAVEAERKGRLGKLEQLSSAVTELQQLTTGWNDVVDKNLQTQQLHVAVEAVRASLEDSTHPRPFVRELVALREIASEDPVVNAAIASINPTAYQRGIATSSQLIDRFRRVADEVRKAALLPDDAGVASHASSWVLSKVMFKKQGLAAGDDVESILTRTQTYLEEGDLDNAAREMNGLTGWAKTLSRDWLSEIRKVLEVQQALDVIAAEARLQSLRVEQ